MVVPNIIFYFDLFCSNIMKLINLQKFNLSIVGSCRKPLSGYRNLFVIVFWKNFGRVKIT